MPMPIPLPPLSFFLRLLTTTTVAFETGGGRERCQSPADPSPPPPPSSLPPPLSFLFGSHHRRRRRHRGGGGTGRQKGGEGGEEANAKSLLPPSWRRRSHDARFQWHLLAQSKEGNQGRKEQQQIDGTRRRKEKETTREKRAMASVPSSSPSYSQPSPHRLLPKKSLHLGSTLNIRICSIFSDLKGGGCFATPPTASCSQYYLLINASSIANPRCRTCSMLQFLLPDISINQRRKNCNVRVPSFVLSH